jgi:replicative DNA helicase
MTLPFRPRDAPAAWEGDEPGNERNRLHAPRHLPLYAAGEADLIVAKQRNGPTATVTVAFQGHYSRLADMAP